MRYSRTFFKAVIKPTLVESTTGGGTRVSDFTANESVLTARESAPETASESTFETASESAFETASESAPETANESVLTASESAPENA